jgi:glycosyltransferase involved in cell wall biosynthesis
VVVPDPYASRSLARRLHERVHVVMVGRIARWKGQDVFVRAFAEAFPDGGARGTVVGAPVFGEDDDVYAADLEALVAGLPGSVDLTLAGARDDVESILATADIVVHASRTPEPFGQVIVEAMAAGAVVVATEGGGPSEIIRHGVDGLLDPDERDRLGTAARARVAHLCDPARIGAEVAAIHDRAMAARR